MKTFNTFLWGKHERFGDEKHYRSFFAVNLLSLLCLIVMAALSVLFAFTAKDSTLTLLQCAGIALCAVALALNFNGVRRAPLFILVGTFSLLFLLWISAFGWKSGLQWLYLAIVLIAIYLYSDLSLTGKLMLTVAIGVVFALGFYIDSVSAVIQGADSVEAAMTIFIPLALVFLLVFHEAAQSLVHGQYAKTIAAAQAESMHDPLTGLWNRRYFQAKESDHLALAKVTPHCVAILDIDFFKNVNDTYGHPIGDQMLIHFSQLMISNFRSTDIILRWGGEEFMILFFGATLERAVAMLDKFRETVKKSPLKTGNHEVPFAFTAGVASLDPGMSILEAASAADEHLYAGKQGGRDRVVSNLNKR